MNKGSHIPKNQYHTQSNPDLKIYEKQEQDTRKLDTYDTKINEIQSSSLLQMGRYFVIKSIDEENIHKVSYSS